MTTSDVSKRPEGVTLIAIVHFVLGGLGILSLIAVIIGGAIIASVAAEASLPVFMVLSVICLVVGIGSVVAIVAGVGLLQMRNWARWVTIVLAILNLPVFPIGTVIGGLMIWYLLQESIAAQFEKRVVVEPAQPTQPVQPKPTEVVEPARETPEVTIPPQE